MVSGKTTPTSHSSLTNYLNFNVANPTNTSSIVIIQNLTVAFGVDITFALLTLVSPNAIVARFFICSSSLIST